MTHRYPTRYQQKLLEQVEKKKAPQPIYLVNLTERSYIECFRSKVTQTVKSLIPRWQSSDKVVICPENCKGYVYLNFNRIY